MSITSNLLDQIVPFIGNWSRSTGVNSALALLQEGQDELFDCDAAGLIWYGTDNKGWPPYLITVSETYRYEINAANLSGVANITKTINGQAYNVRAKQIRRVFVDTNKDFDYGRHFLGEPYVFSFNNPMRASNDRVEVAEIPVDNEPARENDNPVVQFKANPGATTDIYFVEFSWEPPRLTSEVIPVCVPSRFYAALKDYVIGRISEMDNGKVNDRLTRFYNGYDGGSSWVPSWKDQFHAFYDSGAKTDSGQTVPLW